MAGQIPRYLRRAIDHPIVGRWRITWMEMWEQDTVDEAVEGYFEFDAHGMGEFQFIYVCGQISYSDAEDDGRRGVEFTWEGSDEMDFVHGRGWAYVNGDEIDGLIVFHGGDQSKFTARRKKARTKKRPTR